MGEFDLIEAIRARTALRRDDVRLGIGDDAALLAPPAGHLLASSIDTLVEGVHFPAGTAPRISAGRRWRSIFPTSPRWALPRPGLCWR